MSTSTKLSKGSQVYLKSGGPVMSVEEVTQDVASGWRAKVIWYCDASKRLFRDSIAIEALEVVE